MCPRSIPIRFTLRELCAAALLEVAEVLEAARDAETFLATLERNRRLWLAMREIVADGWPAPSPHCAEFALRQPAGDGRGISDAVVDLLVRNNRRAAENLLDDGGRALTGARVRLAWEEGEEGEAGDFLDWLIAQIRTKFRIHALLDQGLGAAGETERRPG